MFTKRVVLVQMWMVIGLFLQAVLTAAGNEPSREGLKRLIERPGLLVLSHGAPMAQWNGPVNALVKQVRVLNEESGMFHAVEGAFLEFSGPDAAEAVEKLSRSGCDHIVVVPLFIAPSSHSHFDVPAVLGMYSSAEIHRTLKEEGARTARSAVPLTLIQTLGEGDLLERVVSEDLRSMSKNPKEEALVVIAHGCADHHNLVDRLVRRVVTSCCGRMGIEYGDWAYCEVGQGFWREAVPAVIRASEHKKKVLVVGLYVSSSADRIYKRALKTAVGPMGQKIENPLEKIDVLFSDKGVVDYAKTAEWLLESADQALKRLRENMQ